MDTSSIKEAVHEVLNKYEAALNASDTNAVMALYLKDGIFMPQHSDSAIGDVAIRQAYDGVFKAIELTVKFKIAEIEELSPDWAFARTNSAGSVKIHANGAEGKEANQELFIFKKDKDDSWKIARYCFCVTTPPKQ